MASNSRKQRYRLDIDDILSRAFLTVSNADELILGLNESNTSKKLALVVGGTNNAAWAPGDDRQFVMFDAANKALVPSGFIVPTGAQSIQIPYITGAAYKNDGINSLTDSGTATDLVTQNLTLPATSQWVDIHLTFQFTVHGIYNGDQHNSLTSLKLLLGADGSQAASILSLYPQAAAAGDDDTNTVTWVAIGEIPVAHQLDSTLTVRVSGIPHDVGSVRACVTRCGYRGTVDMASRLPKGVHHYVTPVLLKHCSWGNDPHVGGTTPTFAWESHNVSSVVPPGASAVILQTYGAGRRNVVEVWSKPTAATPDANKLLVHYMETGEEDHSGFNNQIFLPFGSVASAQSIQLQSLTSNLDYGWYKIFAIGYVS